MKIKSMIITISLIMTMISGIGVKYFDKTKDVDIANAIVNENVVANAEENTIDEKQEEQTENETNAINIETPIETEENNKETSEIVTTQKNIASKNEPVNKNTSTSESIQEQKTEINTETQKKKEETPQTNPVTNTITESDLEYWCVAGGDHHVAGDRANEHGYYSSWDEAYQAFETYTKGWSSVQFKISQCSCGLYYFWAIQ